MVLGAGGVQAFDALEDEFDGRLHTLWPQHLYHLRIDFLDSERGIDIANTIYFSIFTGKISVRYHLPHTPFFQQCDGCTKSAEFFQAGHIDTVEIGIAHLRRAADHHYLLGVQAVENLEDALPEGRATNDAVIDDDEVVLVRFQTAVGDVIDVGRKVVAGTCLGDEGPQLDIFPRLGPGAGSLPPCRRMLPQRC